MSEIEALKQQVRNQELAFRALILAITNGGAGGFALCNALGMAAQTLEDLGHRAAADVIYGGMRGADQLAA